MEYMWLVVAVLCTVVVPIALCVGIGLLIHHEDMQYQEQYGSVLEYQRYITALHDAVHEEDSW